jgi:hypothetical protein
MLFLSKVMKALMLLSPADKMQLIKLEQQLRSFISQTKVLHLFLVN